MIRINGKVFLNIQEAVGWLMANNALPFQCTANYVADTEISLSTIVNPSPAEVRIGSIVFFADSKAATVTGITDDSFTVGADHIDMGDIHHVTGNVSITGDLSVSNINVSNNANVGKLNSEKLNQKYEGAIKAELHVDEQGIVEFVNGSNTGRFDTAKVIKPSEVKTEIYDTQANKRMSFRLPYFEASAGNHRLLTEEDLGGGSDVDIDGAHFVFSPDNGYNFTMKVDIVVIASRFVCISVRGFTGAGQSIPGMGDAIVTIQLPETLRAKLSPIFSQSETQECYLKGGSKEIMSSGNYSIVIMRYYVYPDSGRIYIYGETTSIGAKTRFALSDCEGGWNE